MSLGLNVMLIDLPVAQMESAVALNISSEVRPGLCHISG